MTYCFDLDGVICEDLLMDSVWGKECSEWDSMRWIRYYNEVGPNEDIIEKMSELKKSGHIVIIYTARSSLHKEITQKWLAKHNVPYNQLVLDKPKACLYIDDRAANYQIGDSVKELFEKAKILSN